MTGLDATVGGVQLALMAQIALALEVGSSCGLYAALGSRAPRDDDAMAHVRTISHNQPITILRIAKMRNQLHASAHNIEQ